MSVYIFVCGGGGGVSSINTIVESSSFVLLSLRAKSVFGR